MINIANMKKDKKIILLFGLVSFIVMNRFVDYPQWIQLTLLISLITVLVLMYTNNYFNKGKFKLMLVIVSIIAIIFILYPLFS